MWPILEEMNPLLGQLESNKANLTEAQQADDVFKKYREVYETAKHQKSELEEIKSRANNYSEPFESISKWITEADRLLVKAKPLAALPQLVEEQLATIKVSSSMLLTITDNFVCRTLRGK